MSIASLVLRIRPETRPQAEAALLAFPGVECHGMSEDGRLIVTVEDAPQAAMSDTLIAIHRVPQVLAATLGRKLIRLQCYEGLDVASAVYEWNYAAQMIAINTRDRLCLYT